MRQRTVRHRLDGWIDPAVAFRALHANASTCFWLDSGIDADRGMSYFGSGVEVVTASVTEGTVRREPGAEHLPGTIIDFLAEQLPALPGESIGCPLGWIGWIGYEVGANTLSAPPTRSSRYPDAALLFADRLVEIDHAAGTIDLVALGDAWTGELEAWRVATLARLHLEARHPRPTIAHPTQAVAHWRDSDADYLASIAECQAAIREGDAYQLCLTTEVSVDGVFDPLSCYLALRSASPSHHGGFLRIAGVSLLSSSPEQFLSVGSDGIVTTKPIKGTRPRGATPAADDRLRAELQHSEKERAENLMIVDLMRNDLGRVCEVGSVAVPQLLAVESYAQVHQLVSTVRGRLSAGLRATDAVASCFPAGSMTGAPKRRATEILDALERRPRGLYSGAFGYFGIDGSVDLAMVIRSIVLDDVGATIGAGGGITALSDPDEEQAEVKLKAAVLLAVLGA